MMVFLHVKYLQGFKETAVTKSIKQLLLERGRLLGLAAVDGTTSSYRQKGDAAAILRVGEQNMQLKDVSVLITGGGSGLGAATARAMAAKGARVAVLDQNKE